MTAFKVAQIETKKTDSNERDDDDEILKNWIEEEEKKEAEIEAMNYGRGKRRNDFSYSLAKQDLTQTQPKLSKLMPGYM